MKKSTKIEKIANNSKNLAMDLVRWIKPNRKDTLKYVLMFDFGYEENELIGLNCKEMSALIVALRAHQKMFKSTFELLEQDV